MVSAIDRARAQVEGQRQQVERAKQQVQTARAQVQARRAQISAQEGALQSQQVVRTSTPIVRQQIAGQFGEEIQQTNLAEKEVQKIAKQVAQAEEAVSKAESQVSAARKAEVQSQTVTKLRGRSAGELKDEPKFVQEGVAGIKEFSKQVAEKNKEILESNIKAIETAVKEAVGSVPLETKNLIRNSLKRGESAESVVDVINNQITSSSQDASTFTQTITPPDIKTETVSRFSAGQIAGALTTRPTISSLGKGPLGSLGSFVGIPEGTPTGVSATTIAATAGIVGATTIFKDARIETPEISLVLPKPLADRGPFTNIPFFGVGDTDFPTEDITGQTAENLGSLSPFFRRVTIPSSSKDIEQTADTIATGIRQGLVGEDTPVGSSFNLFKSRTGIGAEAIAKDVGLDKVTFGIETPGLNFFQDIRTQSGQIPITITPEKIGETTKKVIKFGGDFGVYFVPGVGGTLIGTEGVSGASKVLTKKITTITPEPQGKNVTDENYEIYLQEVDKINLELAAQDADRFSTGLFQVGAAATFGLLRGAKGKPNVKLYSKNSDEILEAFQKGKPVTIIKPGAFTKDSTVSKEFLNKLDDFGINVRDLQKGDEIIIKKFNDAEFGFISRGKSSAVVETEAGSLSTALSNQLSGGVLSGERKLIGYKLGKNGKAVDIIALSTQKVLRGSAGKSDIQIVTEFLVTERSRSRLFALAERFGIRQPKSSLGVSLQKISSDSKGSFVKLINVNSEARIISLRRATKKDLLKFTRGNQVGGTLDAGDIKALFTNFNTRFEAGKLIEKSKGTELWQVIPDKVDEKGVWIYDLVIKKTKTGKSIRAGKAKFVDNIELQSLNVRGEKLFGIYNPTPLVRKAINKSLKNKKLSLTEIAILKKEGIFSKLQSIKKGFRITRKQIGSSVPVDVRPTSIGTFPTTSNVGSAQGQLPKVPTDIGGKLSLSATEEKAFLNILDKKLGEFQTDAGAGSVVSALILDTRAGAGAGFSQRLFNPQELRFQARSSLALDQGFKQEQDLIAPTQLETVSKSVLDSQTGVQDTGLTQGESLIQAPSLSQSQSFSQIQVPEQVQTFGGSPALPTTTQDAPQITTPGIGVGVPLLPEVVSQIPTTTDLQRVRKKAYDVFVKQRGKFEQVADNLPLGRALRKGANITKQTLASRFKVIRDKKATTIQTDVKFRPDPKNFRTNRIVKGKKIPLPQGPDTFEFIERKSRRLTTRSETGLLVGSRGGRSGGLFT